MGQGKPNLKLMGLENVQYHFGHRNTKLVLWLISASKDGDVDAVKSLIKRGADPNAKKSPTFIRKTALHYAAVNGHLGVVQVLIKHKAKVDAKDYNKKTALHHASANGHIEAVQELINHKANVNAKERQFKTALHYASEYGHIEVVQELINHKANVDDKDEDRKTALHYASADGHIEVVQELINHKANIDTRDSYEKTALHHASANGHIEVVQELINHKANVDAKDYYEKTALHHASENGHIEVVQELINHKANVDAKDYYEKTALHHASENGHIEVVQELINHKANVDAKDYYGKTALHFASENRHVEVEQALLGYKASVEVKDGDGRTALHLACIRGYTEIAKFLVQKKANINIKDNDGRTPFELSEEMKTFPQRHSAIPNEIRGKKAQKIFRQALKRGHVPVHHARLMIVGHFGVGKSTITKALLQETDEIHKTTSTDGIEVYVGRCRADLDTGKWEKQNLGHRKTNPIRQKVQQILYEERRQEILEMKDTSLNPFAENFIFKTTRNNEEPTKSQKQIHAELKLSTQSDAALSESFKSNAAIGDIDEKPSVQLHFTSNPDDKNKEQPAKLSSADVKQFIPKDQDLLPSATDTLKKFDENYCDIELWDFGGQSAFYTTHQTFLSPRCTYLLVIDGSLDLDDEVDDEELIPGEHTSRKSRAFTRFWTVSIITYAKGLTKGYPKIIPVITHLDKVPQDQRVERVKYIFDEIRMVCEEHNIEEHLVLDPRLSINALNPADKGYSVLRGVILATAKSYPEWGELMPASWVPLEHSLMAMKTAGYKILPISRLAEINQGNDLQRLEDEECLAFLQFQHSIGQLLYFSDVKLRNYIILHPKWLIDALRSLITAERFLKEEQRSMSNSGVLHISLLEQLWKYHDCKEFLQNADHLLKTMEKMDLLAVPMSYDDEGNVIPSQRFIVPSMIKTDMKRGLIESLTSTQKPVCLLYTFYSKLLPKAIFNRLAASCINIWPLYSHNDSVLFYSGFCSFKIDLFHIMSIRMLPYQILIMVTGTNQNHAISNSLCAGVHHFLSNELSRICEVHKQIKGISKENRKFYAEIPCCAEHLECVQMFTESATDTLLTCSHHDGKDNMPGPRTWIQEVEGYSRVTDVICSNTNLCPEKKQQKLTVKELGRLSRRIHGTRVEMKMSFVPTGEFFNELEEELSSGKIGIREYCFRILVKVNADSAELEKLHRDLMDMDEENAHVLCKVLRRRHAKYVSNLKAEFMFSKPSQELLNQLSDRIPPGDAFQLYIELGIELNVIDRARLDIVQNVLKQIRFILNEEWRKQTTSRPTFEILEKALIESGIDIKYLKEVAPDIMRQ